MPLSLGLPINPTLRARVLQGASVFIRSHMATKNPFTGTISREEVHSVLAEAVLRSCSQFSTTGTGVTALLSSNANITEEEFDMLHGSIDDINAELEELARELVMTHFGFTDPLQTPDPAVTIAENKQKVLDLKRSKDLFHRMRPDGRVSIWPSRRYQHPIFQDFVFRAWFSQGPGCAGRRAAPDFDDDGIPITTIAFAMSMLYSAIQEWTSGQLNMKDFLRSPAEIAPNFHNSRTMISLWEKHTKSTGSALTFAGMRTLMLHNVRDDCTGF